MHHPQFELSDHVVKSMTDEVPLFNLDSTFFPVKRCYVFKEGRNKGSYRVLVTYSLTFINDLCRKVK